MMEATRILVVDDEEPICKLTQSVLKQKGYQVLWAVNGKIAMDIFMTFKPDVVILDVFMPDGSGIDVLRAMLASDPGVKVVMMSGLHDLGVAKEAMYIGAKEYFVKPVNFELMVSTIEKLHPSQQS